MQMIKLPVTSLCWNELTRSGATFLIVLDPEQVRQTSDPPPTDPALCQVLNRIMEFSAVNYLNTP